MTLAMHRRFDTISYNRNVRPAVQTFILSGKFCTFVSLNTKAPYYLSDSSFPEKLINETKRCNSCL